MASSNYISSFASSLSGRSGGAIYIHIPFCKQACHYCDFHFSTSMKKKEEMVLAIAKELQMRKNELLDCARSDKMMLNSGKWKRFILEEERRADCRLQI